MGTREFGQEFEGYANTSFYFDSGCNTGSHFFRGIHINHYMFTGSHRVHLYQIFEEVTEPSDGRWLHFSFVINIETLLHNRATCSSQSSGSSQVLVAMFAGFSVS